MSKRKSFFKLETSDDLMFFIFFGMLVTLVLVQVFDWLGLL